MRIRMKWWRNSLVRTSMLLLLFLLFIWPAAFPWGSVGHRFINTNAVYHLPGQMVLFIQDSTAFGQHASDADYRKSSDTSEGQKHFIDIDDYPDYQNLPHTYDSVVALYGAGRVWYNGILPWATVHMYDSLVAKLSRGDWAGALLNASDLGHYVGDGHQPLHDTKNYDGYAPQKIGIHSRYETQMLGPSYYGNALVITPDSTHYIADRLGFAFDYILHGTSLADSILHGDAYAKSISGWSGSGSAPAAYYTALWGYTGAMTLDQMQHATVALADLWYSAWVDAGLITPTGVQPQAATLTSTFYLEQNYPNPFNPTTTISYVLPVGGSVRLSVFSLEGREVATLVDGIESAGRHVVPFDGRTLASGVYLYELKLGRFTEVRKLLLLR
jgi:hypothetical protein